METYTGHVRTPADAIILFEACRLGLLPRVQRRLSEKERQSIKSGSVFVWDEREAGMRRWTDGKSWSASRVSGSFLTYREMEGKRGGSGFAPPLAAARAGKTPDSTRGSDSDLEMAGDDGHDGYRYKPDGLMKQSFSITTSSGNHLHLISYYARSHPNTGGLCSPSNDAQLRHIRPQKGMYPESTVHEQQNIPPVTRAPMAPAPYSTVPHMAGYARSGPPQQQMNYVQNGYGWAPPPWPLQNGNGNGYQNYGHHYAPHGPPAPEHSPLSHSQSVENPTSEPHQNQGPQPHPYDRSPYDRSPRPSDNLPPPPQHHRSSSSGNGQQQHRSYPTERSRSGPIHQQGPYVYEHPSQHYSQHQSPYSQPPHSPYTLKQQYPLPPQHHPQTQPPPQSHLPNHSHPQKPPSPPMSKIDPRLMAPSPLPQQQPTHSAHSRTPSPQPHSAENTQKPASQPQTNGNSAASTIPSIGSIMNGPTEQPAANTDAKSDRSGSKSPGGTPKKRDAGHEVQDGSKLGFKEDVRAIRVLDRAFRT